MIIVFCLNIAKSVIDKHCIYADVTLLGTYGDELASDTKMFKICYLF